MVQITDWDDAYANRDHIPDAVAIIEQWPERACKFKAEFEAEGGVWSGNIAYGDGARQTMDVFRSKLDRKGVFVFVHGGYWMNFCKDDWSFLASGPLGMGYDVVIPSYDLCPDVTIAEIVQQIALSVIKVCETVDGDVVLCGHSAGGHLVSRMVCQDTELPDRVLSRIKQVISISGVYDLRPILRLELNKVIGVDKSIAKTQSPALLEPLEGVKISCIVGGDERPEFIRQNQLLANIWRGLGADSKEIIIAGKHHFSIIEELAHPRLGWLSQMLAD